MKQMLFMVSLRRVATGYKEAAFMVEDLNQAYLMASILVASPAYSHCHAVATDWKGEVVFTQYPQQAQPQVAPAPMPQYAPSPMMPQQTYQHQQYAQQPQYAYQAPQQAPYMAQAPRPQPQTYVPALPPHQPRQAVVIDADFEEVAPQTSRIRALGR